MFVLEEPKSKKRLRTSSYSEDLEPPPTAKKPKSTSENPSGHRRRPPSYWNTLSRVWLTRGALKEFHRRHIPEEDQQTYTLIPDHNPLIGRTRQRLQRFARRGGPDLSHLRGIKISKRFSEQTQERLVKLQGFIQYFLSLLETKHIFRLERDLPLGNLKPFDDDLSDLRPDVYHGAALSTVHPQVRADLGPYIIPSTVDLTRPAAPNFFVEGKSPQGRADVARRQALIDGAAGARAMHQLRNYGAEVPEYDNRARSFSTTFHAGTGTFQTYAHHLTAPFTPGRQPEYHMTQTKGFALTGDKETFIRGATAYRNDRDLAKTERDSLIAQANQVARQMTVLSPHSSLTTSRTSTSTRLITGSDTSEDELARDEVTPVKRPRPSVASPVGCTLATGRDGRTASEAPMAISRASMAAPKTTTTASRQGRQPSMEESIPRQSTSHIQNKPKRSSLERPSVLSKPFQSVQDSNQRRLNRPMDKVNSKRTRHQNE